MLEQRLDSRDPPIVTKTDAVIIEAPPGPAESSATSVSFKAEQLTSEAASADGAAPPSPERVQGPLTRGGFTNSKESAFLTEIRRESLENEELGGRSPPIVTDEAVIVEAAPGR